MSFVRTTSEVPEGTTLGSSVTVWTGAIAITSLLSAAMQLLNVTPSMLQDRESHVS
jgi:hypothetical protein